VDSCVNLGGLTMWTQCESKRNKNSRRVCAGSTQLTSTQWESRWNSSVETSIHYFHSIPPFYNKLTNFLNLCELTQCRLSGNLGGLSGNLDGLSRNIESRWTRTDYHFYIQTGTNLSSFLYGVFVSQRIGPGKAMLRASNQYPIH